MTEILGAVIGALLGGVLTWYITRQRPTYIWFDWDRKYQIGFDSLPHTKILYRDIPIKNLYILRLRAVNTGSRVIKNPEFVIKLQEGAKVLGASAEIIPSRKGADCQVSTKENEVELTINRLYPYSLNRELLLVYLFGNSELKIEQISGEGVFQDGTGWSTRFWEAVPTRIPFLNVWFYPWSYSREYRREIVYLAITILGFVALLIISIVCVFLNPLSGVLSIDFEALRIWINRPCSWLVLGSLVAFIIWAFAMGLRGWILPIPLPFFGRTIHIQFVKTKRLKE